MEKITSGIIIRVTKEEQRILKDFYDVVFKDNNISNEDTLDILDSIATECSITENGNIEIEFIEE